MSDPFRANSNSQLIREAQIAFIVIGALLCVLVYVAFHRVSGRKFHFQQISRTAPVAENVADVPYPAQVLIEEEDHAIQKAFNTINALAHPQPDATPSSMPSTAENQAAPKVTSFEALPIAEIGVAAATPVVTMPSIAQANFIEPAAEKNADGAPFEKVKQLKPFAPLPKPDTPLPNKLSPIKSFPVDQKLPPKVDSGSGDPFPSDSETSFTPPVIESNFGASAARKLSSFEPPVRTPGSKTDADQPRPDTNQVVRSDVDLKIESTIKADFAKTEFAKTELATPKPATPKSFVALPKQQAPKPFRSATPDQILSEPNSYEVQPNDSLWSIATEKYGDGRFFRALHQHNRERIASIEQLQPHTVILIPELTELKKRYSGLCPADQLRSDVDQQDSLAAENEIREQALKDRYYITQSGDTLFDVARQRLGQASRYLEIYKLNQFRIPEQVNHLTPLKPGLRLLLPE